MEQLVFDKVKMGFGWHQVAVLVFIEQPKAKYEWMDG
jgi:hypothetical protein